MLCKDQGVRGEGGRLGQRGGGGVELLDDVQVEEAVHADLLQDRRGQGALRQSGPEERQTPQVCGIKVK